jgi:hypothetical protein
MSKIAQMLESLVNDDQAKAEELFHEYVVEKSREIYEGLIENELDLEEGDDQLDLEEGDDQTDSFMKSVEVSDEEGEEGSEEGDEGPEEEGPEEEGEGDEDEPATKGDINSLADAVRQLEAELSQMMGGDEGGMDNMDGFNKSEELEIEDLDSMGQGFGDLETVREYVEKVGAGHGAEKKGSSETAGTQTKSVVAKENNMGGTTANIVAGGEGSEAGTKGGLLDPSTKDLNGGNVNVPGSKTATKLSPVTKGHGAEKKGAGEEGGTVKTSLFRK